MAITGSQKAYTQARSGIARSGATRSGYYIFRTVVTIDHNGTPTDVSAHVAYNGWAISMNINDEIDTATLRLLPSLPFVPVTRSPIRIGFGGADNVQFAGLVLTAQRRREPGPAGRWWSDLTCVDWLTVFDAHFVLAEYPAQSVTTTILDIVARFTRGGFLTDGVAPDMPIVDGFQVINERPSTVLRRLTNLVGGGFYIDAARRLRAWSASLPTPMLESGPQPLTDTLASLKTFRVTTDATQQRTRVFVEGQRTATVIGVAPTEGSIAVQEDYVVRQGESATPGNLTRVGTQIGQAFYVFHASATPADNPAGTVITVDAAAGAAALNVADNSAFAAFAPRAGWASIAGQVIGVAPDDVPTVLLVVNTSGTGSLQAPVSAGTQIVPMPWMQFDAQDRSANPADPLFVPGPMRGQPDATPVVLVAREDAPTAAAALAAREGSDGFYEHLVQDGRYTDAGARARARAELADFTDPLVTYEWETDDLNAEPGRMQTIALVNGGAVNATVRITNVEVTPIAAGALPRRSVRATAVQAASVLDVWVDDPR